MKSFQLFAAFCVAFALVIASGCGESGPKTVTITGTVSLDGTPIPEGDILFRDAAGNAGSCAAKITNGAYEMDSTLGAKKVEIRAMREVPGKMDESNPGESVPMQEMYIPKKYNTESELTADVSESGQVDFELESGS